MRRDECAHHTYLCEMFVTLAGRWFWVVVYMEWVSVSFHTNSINRIDVVQANAKHKRAKWVYRLTRLVTLNLHPRVCLLYVLTHMATRVGLCKCIHKMVIKVCEVIGWMCIKSSGMERVSLVRMFVCQFLWGSELYIVFWFMSWGYS